MKIAVLIQCHSEVDLLNRLLTKFEAFNNIDVYIHVDKKSLIKDDIKFFKNVFYTKNRIDVQWGTSTQIYATLELLKAMCSRQVAYDYVLLISGQDYLCKSVGELIEFLKDHIGQEFIENSALPKKELSYAGGIGRLSFYWIDQLTPNRNFYAKLLRNVYLRFIAPFYKKNISELGKLYYGSSWFAITGHCANYIVDFLSKNSSYLHIYDKSGCADEIFFQTLIMNSPFSKNVISKNLHYIKWDNNSSPLILKDDDYTEIIKSDSFFIRKVSSIESKDLLDRLDKII